MTTTTIPTLTLNNGLTMPALGFGVFQTAPASPSRPTAAREALKVIVHP